MELKIKKLRPEAIMPTYGTDGAACFDLCSLHYGYLDGAKHPSGVFQTGLAFEIPPGWAMMIYSRSGHGFKNGTRLANCVGVIDADYRGEVMVKLAVDQDGALTVKPGDRIAQAMLVPVECVTFVEVDDLSATERGAGGFGSTGR